MGDYRDELTAARAQADALRREIAELRDGDRIARRGDAKAAGRGAKDAQLPPDAASTNVAPVMYADTSTRARRVVAGLTVALGAIVAGGAPIVYPAAGGINPTTGRAMIAVGIASLCSIGAILALPAVCYGFLAPGTRSVRFDVVTQIESVVRHGPGRARPYLLALLIALGCEATALACLR
ncbi:MAG: hypothetical protein WCJ30_14760 [Deltaproteobacteria bacterium]